MRNHEHARRFSRRVLLALLLSAALAAGVPPLPAQKAPGAPKAADGRKKIVVVGSSLAAGWVTSHEKRYDFRNGFAYRLERLLAERGFDVVNAAVPGDTTKDVLDRLDRDLVAVKPDLAFVVLSLGNEGLAGPDPQQAVDNFKQGMTRIVARLKEAGIPAVLGSCYASNLFAPDQYRLLQDTNRWLDGLGLPLVNFLGALEDGRGHFPEELLYDPSHPGNRGHEELFYAIPPSLFPSLLAGRPLPPALSPAGPEAPGRKGKRPAAGFVPDDVMHSFSLAFAFRSGGDGPLARVDAGEKTVEIRLESGRVRYAGTADGVLASLPAADGKWHQVVLSHRHLPGETSLYVDGVCQGAVRESLVPRCFQVAPPPGRPAEYRDLRVYRAALTAVEAAGLARGDFCRASLELYAPAVFSAEGNRPGPNLAQTAARLLTDRNETAEALRRIEEKIRRSDEQRRAEAVFPEKVALRLPPGQESLYTGTYEVGPGDSVSIEWAGGAFFVVDKGRRQQIFPETPECFFVKYPVADIEVVFSDRRDRGYGKLELRINGQARLQASRKEP